MKTEHINSPINDEEYIRYTPARQASSKKLESFCQNVITKRIREGFKKKSMEFSIL